MNTRFLDACRKDADLIKAIHWLATLDTHTRPECRIRDGKQYSLNAFDPIGHAAPWLGGPGKILPDCRCVALPVLRSYRELGIPIDDMPVGTRASMFGQVPADLYYPQWIEMQTEEIQECVLGTERTRLLRVSGLSYTELHAEDGVFLNLDDLRRRHVLAFVLAGLH